MLIKEGGRKKEEEKRKCKKEEPVERAKVSDLVGLEKVLRRAEDGNKKF